MDFRLTDDQELLLRTGRDLCARECPTTLLRAVHEDAAASKPLWDHLRAFAALATQGAGDLAVFVEQCGYAAAPGAFFPTAALFGPLLAAAGLDTSDVEAGEQSGTVAIAHRDGVWSAHSETTKHWVLDVGVVDEVAVIAPGPTLTVVSASDVEAREVETIDPSRRVYAIEAPTGASVPVDREALAAWLDRAYIAIAAETLGTTRRLFDMSLTYAKDRVQFDRPIGSFQAMQHKLAEMSLDVERATAAVYYAAMTFDADAPERARACHVAKATVGIAARRVLKDAIQIHGGIGYTWEHDLHLFMRRATLAESLLGTTSWHHDRIADLIF